MRGFTKCVALGLIGAAVASDVHDLTKDNFADFIAENDLVLAECKHFYCLELPLELHYANRNQSLPHGVDTARLSPPSTKPPPQL